MKTVTGWLEGRAGGVPEALRRLAFDSIAMLPTSGDVADDLYAAGCHHLDRARGAGPDRAAAADLLVADAFFTWACEAAADSDRPIAGRAERWAAGLASRAGTE